MLISLEGNYERILTKKDNVIVLEIQKYDRTGNHLATIGLDFFKEYIVKIDYFNCELQLSHKKVLDDKKNNIIRLTKNSNNLYIYDNFEIETKIIVCNTVISGKFLIDTGSGRYVTLLNYPNQNFKQLKNAIKKTTI